MAEPHDRCTFDGCTLGRAHTGAHAGPLCPACGAPCGPVGDGRRWRCWTVGCKQRQPIPEPAEPHDRCTLDGCTLGRAHVGEHVGPRCPRCREPGIWVYAGAAGGVSAWYCRGGRCGYGDPLPVPAEPARQPMPAASPLASGMRLPNEPSDVDQVMLDIEAEARECDEDARSKQRRAAELRSMLSYLRAWRDSAGLRKWARDDKSHPAPTGVASTGRGSNP